MKDRDEIDEVPESDIEVEPFSEGPEIDPGEAVEEAEPYFPPTDPVVRQGPKGATKIAGGFGAGDVPDKHAHSATKDGSSDEGLKYLTHPATRLDATTAHPRPR